MSIPALGGGGGQALQRALMEAAERALTDELALLDGEDPATTARDTTGAAATTTRAQVRRRATAGRSETSAALLDEAIVVELGEERRTGRLQVADGWITTAKRGPLETREAPQAAPPKRFAGADIRGGETEPAAAPETVDAADAPDTAAPADATVGNHDAAEAEPIEPDASAPRMAPRPQSPGEPVTLERLVVVLKRTGIDFRDAYQVLREIRAGAPLPPRAELRAMWAAADPVAWEERARVRARTQTQGPSRSQVQTPERPPAAVDTDLRQTRVDDLIRDRGWHRTAAHQSSTATGAPTLQTVAQHTALNQAYVAELSTAEFQRLVTILGGGAPEWFWELRGHRGLRGLAERPAIARLNATRIAGTRLGAWLLAIIGMALFWYVGLHTGTWW